MIDHHPSDDTLLRFATADLPAGPSLVVASHIAYCEACRREVRILENVGGAVLDGVEPVALDEGLPGWVADPEQAARERAPRGRAPRAGRGEPFGDEKRTRGEGRRRPPFPDGMILPPALAAYDIGPWHFIAPGIQWASIGMPGRQHAKVLLLKGHNGAALPLHSHLGTEYTCVLHGAFLDEGKVLGVGDLIECGEHDRHRPAVASAVECVCILAVDGRLVMESWLARVAVLLVRL